VTEPLEWRGQSRVSVNTLAKCTRPEHSWRIQSGPLNVGSVSPLAYNFYTICSSLKRTIVSSVTYSLQLLGSRFERLSSGFSNFFHVSVTSTLNLSPLNYLERLYLVILSSQRPSVCRAVCFSVRTHLRLMNKFLLLWQLRACWCGGVLSDERTGL
jgi:hypothetical protein